jgi:hypothetical protein
MRKGDERMTILTPEIRRKILHKIKMDVDEINHYLEKLGTTLRLRIMYDINYAGVYLEAYEYDIDYSHGYIGYFLTLEELELVVTNIRKFMSYLDKSSKRR